MNIKVEGIDALVADLKRTESRLIKKAERTVRTYAQKMADQAQKNAPVKDGFLENSIEILKVETSPERYSVTWGVNNEKLGPGYTRGGFPYHGKMHDGGYRLGPRSKEKASTGNTVGPLYVDRALWQETDAMIAAIEQAMTDALK